MKSKDHIEEILNKIVAETASEEELSELAELVKNDSDGLVALQIEQFLQTEENPEIGLLSEEKTEAMVNNILQADKIPTEKRTRIFHIGRWIAAAAVIILLIGTVVYFGISNSKTTIAKEEKSNLQKNDVQPGGSRALLTLADGSTIVLDHAEKGTISLQGNTKVEKLNDGQLAYSTSKSATGEVLYNTITTPRGGQYQVTLPDGTKVWLNAASSLRFPTAFTGTERKVELNGEGYFEVEKNPNMPFIVKLNNASVQVLGTHFNVMAYNDEADMKTTLLEGSVKIKAEEGSGATKVLKPGEQAVLNKQNDLQIVEGADVEEVVAWKNGYFQFSKIDAQALRQISRWYDVDVVFDKDMKEKEYAGKIARSVKLSNVVEALKIIGIHCKMENNKLIVLPESSK